MRALHPCQITDVDWTTRATSERDRAHRHGHTYVGPWGRWHWPHDLRHIYTFVLLGLPNYGC